MKRLSEVVRARLGLGRGPGDEGVTAVEFALVAPVLLLILGGVVDVSRCLYYQTEVAQAVRAGAQYATGNPADYSGTAAIIRTSTMLGTEASFSADASQCFCAASTPLPAVVFSWQSCASLTCSQPATTVHRYLRITGSYDWKPVYGALSFLPAKLTTTVQLRVQ